MKRTPLARVSPKRAAQLAAEGQPLTTFRVAARKPAPTKRPRYTGPDDETRAVVMDRDLYRCTRCGQSIQGISGVDFSLQHRDPRGMGGSRRVGINSPANLFLVDGSGTTGCHGYMESERTEAYEAGWLLRFSADPYLTPVRTWRGLIWLTDDGGWSTEPPAMDGETA